MTRSMRRSLFAIIAMVMIFFSAAVAAQPLTLAGVSPASTDDVVAMDGVYSAMPVSVAVSDASSTQCVVSVSGAKSLTQAGALPVNEGYADMPSAMASVGAGSGGDVVRWRMGRSTDVSMSGSTCAVCHNRRGST